MSGLIVEDGTGKSDAESYCSVEYADSYHSARNNASWASLDDTVKEAYLRLATEFLIGQYRMRWKGRRVTMHQALDWPRVGVVMEDTVGATFTSYGLFQIAFDIVPEEVKKATSEMALRCISGPLVVDQASKIKSETVGPISITYDTNYTDEVQYRQIHKLLQAYFVGNNAMYKLTRT